MTKIFLESIVNEIDYNKIPSSWNSFNLEKFSEIKTLWGYQQQAIKNSIKVLFTYYKEFNPNETFEKLNERKKKFFKSYKDFGLSDNLDLNIKKLNKNLKTILTDHYDIQYETISYSNFINRMSFWMATGSGKTVIIIKLIQILKKLIDYQEIPNNDILFLTHRDDLLQQFKLLVDEFNQGQNRIPIILRNLKEFPEIKRNQTIFNENSITVFYYRSDNLNDEQKDRIIDFKNYENDGKWYVFLDEAHKGDREESKRQHIYSILSRNGFLFNCSATFIDLRDIITCVFEYNLSSFINSGYGKHIAILKQEIEAFKTKDDFNNDEKQKIVLKSLILLTYISKFFEKLNVIQDGLYHEPLLLTLVNSVNIQDADLKLFFRELSRIANNKIGPNIFNEALIDLREEFGNDFKFIFEDEKEINFDKEILESITLNDVLKYFYNSESKGQIEILRSPQNNKELAFKLKTTSIPFALIKIGDVSNWIRSELEGYEISNAFFDTSFFENLNDEKSHIKILMGSRSFYEGWDSNRPNVINYINIGVGKDAKKFILQSAGRGIRIEPIENVRKRLFKANSEGLINDEIFNKIKEFILPLETLFIFGTNRKSLITVIETLKTEKKKRSVQRNNQKVFKTIKEHSKIKSKFEISKEDYQRLQNYIRYLADDRIILMKFDTNLKKIKKLRENLKNPDDLNFNGKKFNNIELLTQKIFDYF